MKSESRELSVEGMHCQACVGRVQRALEQVSGVQSVEVSLAQQRASVRFDLGTARPADLVAAVEQAGYKARLLEGADPSGG